MSIRAVENSPQYSRDFSIEEISEIVERYDIQDIILDIGDRTITIGNRTDLHKFLVGTDLATYKFNDSNRMLSDFQEVPLVDLVSGVDIKIADSSSYGVPYYTHPVHFRLGENIMWFVNANHKQSIPQKPK